MEITREEVNPQCRRAMKATILRIFVIFVISKGLLQKSVENRLSTALFVSEDFKLEKTITR